MRTTILQDHFFSHAAVREGVIALMQASENYDLAEIDSFDDLAIYFFRQNVAFHFGQECMLEWDLASGSFTIEDSAEIDKYEITDQKISDMAGWSIDDTAGDLLGMSAS